MRKKVVKKFSQNSYINIVSLKMIEVCKVVSREMS